MNNYPRRRCAFRPMPALLPPTRYDAGDEREAITRELAALYRRIKRLASEINELPGRVEGEISRDARYMM